VCQRFENSCSLDELKAYFPFHESSRYKDE
jgi:hypothetical protein